jgi:hypothetical protein
MVDKKSGPIYMIVGLLVGVFSVITAFIYIRRLRDKSDEDYEFEGGNMYVRFENYKCS